MMTEPHGKLKGKKSTVYTAWTQLAGSPDDPKWRSLSERIAQHRLYERNKHVGFLKQAHPYRPYLWTIDFYFPYASGGALYIDECSLVPDVGESEMKAEIMRKANLRFLILKPKMKYEDCMSDLIQIDARLKNVGNA